VVVYVVINTTNICQTKLLAK